MGSDLLGLVCWEYLGVGVLNGLPTGNLLHSYGTSGFLLGLKSSINGLFPVAIYVKLPEGIMYQ